MINGIRKLPTIKSFYMRDQGFVMPAMLPMEEIEYTILKNKIDELDEKFKIRK